MINIDEHLDVFQNKSGRSDDEWGKWEVTVEYQEVAEISKNKVRKALKRRKAAGPDGTPVGEWN